MFTLIGLGIAVAISFFASAPPAPPTLDLWMGHNAFNPVGLEHKPVPILVGLSGNYHNMSPSLKNDELLSYGLSSIVLTSEYGESLYLSMNFLPELIWQNPLSENVTIPV